MNQQQQYQPQYPQQYQPYQQYQQYPPQQPQQKYVSTHPTVLKYGSTKTVIERQICGYIFAIIAAIVFIFLALVFGGGVLHTLNTTFTKVKCGLVSVSFICNAAFFITILHNPDHLKGNPKVDRINYLAYGCIIRLMLAIVMAQMDKNVKLFLVRTMPDMIGLFIARFMYLGEDGNGGCCLCFKPWIHRKVPKPQVVQMPQVPQVYPSAQV